MEEFHIANAHYTIACEEFNLARHALRNAHEFEYAHAEEDFYRAEAVRSIASNVRAIAMQAWLHPNREVVQ